MSGTEPASRTAIARPPGMGRVAGPPATSVGAIVLLVLLLLGGAPADALARADVISRGPQTHQTVALTFDDGYAPQRCLEIADILTELGVTATWFPNGVNVRNSPKTWRRIGRRFPIANHTMHHPSLVGLSRAQIRKELTLNQRTIEGVTGRPMLPILRPTYGAYDDRVLQVADKLGYQVVLWSLSAADTSPNGTDRGIAKRSLRGRPGEIILMHCGPEVTPRILPIVIARYACKGYRFATLDDLLAGKPGVAAKVTCPPPKLPGAKRKEPRTRPADDETATYPPGPSAAASPAARGAPGDAVVDYDLGEATISQEAYPAGSDLREMPVRLQGIVAVPEGEGPFPVAALLHGSYPFCTAPLVDGEVDPYPCPPQADLRQYAGFGELAASVAAQGYVVLAPDLSAEYTNGYGSAPFGERAIAIIDAHLDALAEGQGPLASAAGKADLDRLLLAGHSRGGPLAVRYLTDPAAHHAARALALVAPAFMAPEAVIPADVPAAVVVAECDGDVGPEGAQRYLDEQLPPSRPGLTTLYTLEGGTHNAFSTQLPPDRSASCSEADVLPAAEQRDLASDALVDFFGRALDPDD